ncbi:monovalent cation/H(+) antiporter subunit G [Pseudaminobacter salicylatoxidans]|uniref:monovalent cation/H(+) antiporter subunit G n=1 Tax=Pseudaminobacter salicylatoxidans TaxID=93369 RepID=UPI00031CF714|nr:monovalent cation/H(+) antiporter subunit G [Pseudaminobacter salicylatoxidans]
MSHAADIPVWAAVLTAFFVLVGAGFTVIGALGLLRLKTFYERMHAPTLGSTWGAAGVLIGSIIFFSVLQSRPVLHEALIAVFVTVTTPVTLMLLARAALYRDRAERNPEVPGRAKAQSDEE